MNKNIIDNRKYLNNDKFELNELYDSEKLKTQKEIEGFKFKFNILKRQFNIYTHENYNQLEYFRNEWNNLKIDREVFKDNWEELDKNINQKEDFFGFKEYITDKYNYNYF